MPIYEYECRNCGKISEFLIGVMEKEARIECKYCRSKEMNKIFSKSFISTGGDLINMQNDKTCCGKDERCDIPPCSDGACQR